ncbi:type II secretion system protein GspD [Lelliottia nimipressuralis]|uniref:Type II secretion system protein GspD n=1 Tax=Lelliottia nimipressuralis TaxID=69220 RepID=A0ABY3NWW6_9ENTR|nr:type II secretion system protein GspD [Lelliottia nimipressuralis]RXJ09141.1 type II secretion system protein GspD [Lelliottia nimipressuralis]TYT28075.1 type II secretion system protein GspD [Lelliottia nimipressuralis]
MKFIYFIVLLFSFNSYAGTELEIKKLALPEAISLIYSEVLKVPYMVAPELADDSRVVSFKMTTDVNEREFIERYFGNMNIKIYTKKGIDYITPFTPKENPPAMHVFVYSPQNRTVGYLSDILSGYVSGRFGNSGNITTDLSNKSSSGASNNLNRSGDSLVYYGTEQDIEMVKRILPTIDTTPDEVVVSGYVFEVQTGQYDGSGFLLAAKVISEKFNISLGSNVSATNDFINIKTGSIDAIYSLLKTDNRFSVVSSPRLRVKNNTEASFSVGAEVPVLGSVTVSGDNATQSVEYRNSGVLFKVQPSIKVKAIDLNIQQQLSNFVATDTGVNNSPTLLKRDVSTNVVMSDGDIILIGGLAEQKDSKTSSGWSFFGSRSQENTKTDIVVMLQVRKVPR